MRKINKITNIALIFTLIGVLVCQNIAYASDISCLRVPIRDHERLEKSLPVSGNQNLASQVGSIKLSDQDLINIGIMSLSTTPKDKPDRKEMRRFRSPWRIGDIYPIFGRDASVETRRKLVERITRPFRDKGKINDQREVINVLIRGFKTQGSKDNAEPIEQLKQLLKLTDRFSDAKININQKLSFLRWMHYPNNQGIKMDYILKPFPDITKSLVHIAEAIGILKQALVLLPDSDSLTINAWRKKIERTLERPELRPFVERGEFVSVVTQDPNPFIFVSNEMLKRILDLADSVEGSYSSGTIFEIYDQLGFRLHTNEVPWIRQALKIRQELKKQGLLETVEEQYGQIVKIYTEKGKELWRKIPIEKQDKLESQRFTFMDKSVPHYYTHQYLRQFAQILMNGVIGEIDFYTRIAITKLEDNLIFADLDPQSGVINLNSYKNLFLVNDREVKKVEPISISMDADRNGLLLSGPNMGGKTTTARSIGLAVVLTQAGLLISAEAASLSVFNNIYTVFPSTEQLQTGYGYFEMLIKKLTELSKVAGPGDLIILDEVPTGTEYQELVAITVVLIEDLINSGATVIVTGHLKKAFELIAESTGQTPLMHTIKEENGKMVPDFRLQEGVASRSYGIELTKEAKFPPVVTQLAEAYYRMILEKGTAESVPDVAITKSKPNKGEREEKSDPFESYLLYPIIIKLYPRHLFAFDLGWELCGDTQQSVFSDITEPELSILMRSLRGQSEDLPVLVRQRLQATQEFVDQGEDYLQRLTNMLATVKHIKLDQYHGFDRVTSIRELDSFKMFLQDLIVFLEPLTGISFVDELEGAVEKGASIKERFSKIEINSGDIEQQREVNSMWIDSWTKYVTSTVQILKEIDKLTGVSRGIIQHGLKQPTLHAEGRMFSLENSKPFDRTMKEKPKEADISEKYSDPYLLGAVEQSFNIATDKPIVIFTGPNSSGKSVSMFNVFANTVFALNGYYVSGDLEIGHFDRVFALFGGRDNTILSQSYFFHILKSYAQILEDATEHSLIILDELHGSDNFEIAAIQLAVLHYLKKLGATVLYNTHIRDGIRETAETLGLDIWKTDVKFDENSTELKFLFTQSPDPHLEAKSFGRKVAAKWLTPHQRKRVDDIYSTISCVIETSTDL